MSFAGNRIDKLSANARARAGLGWVPDDRGIYASLTVDGEPHPAAGGARGRMVAGADLRGVPGAGHPPVVDGHQLSGGEQQMLAIARVLRMGSRLLLLDEPSEGLAPVIVQNIGAIIRDIKADGVAVLLVEQNVKFAATVADRHYLLAQGRIVEQLSNADFQARESELLEHLGI